MDAFTNIVLDKSLTKVQAQAQLSTKVQSLVRTSVVISLFFPNVHSGPIRGVSWSGFVCCHSPKSFISCFFRPASPVSLVLHRELQHDPIDVERDSGAGQHTNKRTVKLTKSDKIEQIKMQLLEILSKL